MKDFLGNEIKIGDNVVIMSRLNRQFVKTYVVGFSSQYVEVFEKRYHGESKLRQSPHQIIVIKD